MALKAAAITSVRLPYFSRDEMSAAASITFKPSSVIIQRWVAPGRMSFGVPVRPSCSTRPAVTNTCERRRPGCQVTIDSLDVVPAITPLRVVLSVPTWTLIAGNAEILGGCRKKPQQSKVWGLDAPDSRNQQDFVVQGRSVGDVAEGARKSSQLVLVGCSIGSINRLQQERAVSRRGHEP